MDVGYAFSRSGADGVRRILSYRKRHLPVAKTMILIMLAAACYARLCVRGA